MTNIKTLSLRLPVELFDRIKAAAADEYMSVSTWIRILAKEKLDERERLTREGRGS
jgi:hypothetical protein